MAKDYGSILGDQGQLVLGTAPPPSVFTGNHETKLITIDNQVCLGEGSFGKILALDISGEYTARDPEDYLPIEVSSGTIVGSPAQDPSGSVVAVALDLGGGYVEIATMSYSQITKTFTLIDISAPINLNSFGSSPLITSLRLAVSPSGNKIALCTRHVGGNAIIVFWSPSGVFSGDTKSITSSDTAGFGFGRTVNLTWPKSDLSGDTNERTFYCTSGILLAITVGATNTDPARVSGYLVSPTFTSGGKNYHMSNWAGWLMHGDPDDLVMIAATESQVPPNSQGNVNGYLSLIEIVLNSGAVTSNGQTVFTTTPNILLDNIVQSIGNRNIPIQNAFNLLNGGEFPCVVPSNTAGTPRDNELFIFERDEFGVWSIGYRYSGPDVPTTGTWSITASLIIPDPPSTQRRRSYVKLLRPRLDPSP